MAEVSERRIVFLIGAVQLVNVLDFTMVMPLGPDFARGLSIPMSQIGRIVAGYGQAAAIAGFAGSFFLDRFDRRKALAVAMVGLVLGTLAGGLAGGVRALTLARVIAGVFGGPATSLAYAVVADTIPVERRGKAMGAVMGAFSVAQVLGVPAALILSQRAGWRAPFFVVAGLGLVVALGAIVLLPPLRGHLATTRETTGLRDLLSRPTVLWSLTMTGTLMASGFFVIPNLPAWIQQNLGFPRAQYQWLLAIGGVVSFVTLRLAGGLTDRFGSTRTGSAAAALSIVVMYIYFVAPPAHPAPALVTLIYLAFLTVLGARNVAYNALTTKVPRPAERARFLSIQSTVYHATSGTAAWLSSLMLTVRRDGALVGMTRVALIAMALSALLPLLLWRVESRVTRE